MLTNVHHSTRRDVVAVLCQWRDGKIFNTSRHHGQQSTGKWICRRSAHICHQSQQYLRHTTYDGNDKAQVRQRMKNTGGVSSDESIVQRIGQYEGAWWIIAFWLNRHSHDAGVQRTPLLSINVGSTSHASTAPTLVVGFISHQQLSFISHVVCHD